MQMIEIAGDRLVAVATHFSPEDADRPALSQYRQSALLWALRG
jgi:hypothetical protein